MMSLRSRNIALAAIVCLVTMAGSTHADTLILKDGRVLEGVIRKLDAGYEIVTTDGKRQFVASQDVKSIKLTNEGKADEGTARERLSSLQRSIEAERNLDRIIERYEQFIEMNANTGSAKQAQAELDEWKSKREKNMVKVGRRWLTPEESDKELLEIAKAAEQIGSLVEAGDTEQANTLIRTGLELNPDSITYHYLNGVQQLRRLRYVDARRSFERVSQQVADHPPTLVNLAVLAVQFKRWPQAITSLERAMILAPVNREIIDNVLEFSHLAPESARRGAAYERLMKRMTEQEAILAKQMADQQKLYRYGSKWVDQATFDKAKKEQEAYDAKRAEYRREFDDTLERSNRMQEQINMLERAIRQMEADAVVFDPLTGRAVRRGYPAGYWDAQRDLDRARHEKSQYDNRLNELRRLATELDATAPKPPFDGRLTMIGERGVPVMLPASATADPATAPSDISDPTEPTTRPSAPAEWHPPMLPPA